jgi:hypothetical protein
VKEPVSCIANRRNGEKIRVVREWAAREPSERGWLERRPLPFSRSTRRLRGLAPGGTPFESTPWRTPPSYTSSTNTGRAYMLAGASSNVRNPAHNACRTPQDSALIEDLRRRRIPGLGGSSKSPEYTKQEPERPEEPPSSPETPSKPSLMRSLVRSPVEPRTYCDPLHLLRQKRRER